MAAVIHFPLTPVIFITFAIVTDTIVIIHPLPINISIALWPFPAAKWSVQQEDALYFFLFLFPVINKREKETIHTYVRLTRNERNEVNGVVRCTSAKWPAEISTYPDPLISRKDAECTITRGHASGHLPRAISVAIYRESCLKPCTGSHTCDKCIQATYHLWIAPAKCLPSWSSFYKKYPWHSLSSNSLIYLSFYLFIHLCI